jgi:hypothetical protein
MSKKNQVTEQEQRELHRDLIAKLSGLFAANIGDMTKLTAMNVAIDFCVASLVYMFKSINTIADLKGKVIGDEVARRIDELVNADSKP